jgi:hypothetical protein
VGFYFIRSIDEEHNLAEHNFKTKRNRSLMLMELIITICKKNAAFVEHSSAIKKLSFKLEGIRILKSCKKINLTKLTK